MMAASSKSPVSVVIPAWNAGRWLRETLESALAQTLPAREIIVVDDGSSDDTAAIASAFAPHVTLIRQANAGGPAARNRGIAASSGEFIALLDNDDLWHTGKLAAQLAIMEADPTIGLVFCDYESFDGPDAPNGLARGPVLESLTTHQITQDGRRITDPNTALRLLDDLYCQIPSTWLLRRSTFDASGGFDLRLRSGGEDLNLAVRIALRAPLAYDTRALTRRRERADSLGRRSNLEYSYVCALERLLACPDVEIMMGSKLRRRIAERSYYLADTVSPDAARHLRTLSLRFASALPPGPRLKTTLKATALLALARLRRSGPGSSP